MAHPQQVEFCKSVKERFPDFFANRFVIDVGSLDINGNNQYLFEDCLYLGIDLALGKNVDIATKGDALKLPDESVDVVVSTECFEHDKFYALTLRNIVRMLKPGGMFLFSCATTGRPEHGTRRSTPWDAPFVQSQTDDDEWCDYYKNLEEKDVREVLDVEQLFSRFAFSIGHQTHDLYFWGIKKGQLDTRRDYSIHVQQDAHRRLLKDKDGLLKDKDVHIGQLLTTLTERDATIQTLHEKTESHRAELGTLLAERDQHVRQLEANLARFQQEAEESNRALTRLRSSLVWRLTHPSQALKARRKRRKALGPDNSAKALVQASGLFDVEWYLNQNPDVALAQVDPIDHYLGSGAAEGRNPHPLFDSHWYLRVNEDVSLAGLNPLVHYIQHGSRDGRSPHPLFDMAWFMSTTGFDRTAAETALGAYLRTFGQEPRWPTNLLAQCIEGLKLRRLDDIQKHIALFEKSS